MLFTERIIYRHMRTRLQTHLLTHTYTQIRVLPSRTKDRSTGRSFSNARHRIRLIRYGSQSTILLDIYLIYVHTRELAASPSVDLWQDACERDDLCIRTRENPIPFSSIEYSRGGTHSFPRIDRSRNRGV